MTVRLTSANLLPVRIQFVVRMLHEFDHRQMVVFSVSHRWTLAAIAFSFLAAPAQADPDADCGVDLEDKCLQFFSSPRSWSPRFDIQDTLHSFVASHTGNEIAFPAAERTKEGIVVTPGLEVRIAKKPGCTFAGEVMLSQSEECKLDPKSPLQVDELEQAKTNNMQFFLSLPEARKLLFADNEKALPFKEMLATKVEFRLFFCVKPGPGEEFKAMHVMWYYQDPDPEGPRAVWEAEDAKIREDLKVKDPEAWRSEDRYRMAPIKLDGIPMDMAQHAYILMHFQAKDPADDEVLRKPKARNAASTSRLAWSTIVLTAGSAWLF